MSGMVRIRTRPATRPALRRPAPQQLNNRGPQRERHEPDYLLMLSIIALSALGLLMVYSSSGVDSLIRNGDPFALAGPQAVWGVLGVVTMVLIMRTDYRYLRLISVAGFLIALALLVIVMLPPIGPLRPVEVGGSTRWLKIGPLPQMHPAEFAKLALVVYLAHWLTRKGSQIKSFRDGFLAFMLIVGPPLALVMIEPDLGTTGVLAMAAVTMFFVAGGSILQLAAMAPIGVAALAFYVTSSQYQLARVKAFIDPWADPQGIGFHTVQGLLAMGMGGPFGIGLGEGRQPGALHLPAAQNDFVFALVAQELGFVGGIAVIACYLLLAYRGIRIALSAPDTFGALLAIGITGWLTFQAFINIAVVVVLLPVTGITLPFVSAGGTSLLVSFAAVGILLSISRETLPRGTFNDADSDRRGWHRRPRLSGAGRRAQPARAGA
ncbi:MAG: putative peptidoglycan glycosyltransferase FtsW [Chloroflexota bacterium]|nr:putative peptidoglycan glycosyltransferase FtsW [Chloroflexota bacterium]